VLILFQELATLPHRATHLPFPLSESVLTAPSSVTHYTFPYMSSATPYTFPYAPFFLLIGKLAVPEAFLRGKRENSFPLLFKVRLVGYSMALEMDCEFDCLGHDTILYYRASPRAAFY
jgi:hypothetical protein